MQTLIDSYQTKINTIEEVEYNNQQNKKEVEDYANNGGYNEQKNLIRDAIKEALESADISITQR